MRLLARLFAVVLVMGALSAFWWLETLRSQSPPTRADASAAPVATSYFEAFRLRDRRGEGSAVHVLRGERMTHFRDQARARVTAPRLAFTPADAPPWRARAERGTLTRAGERLELIGDVVLVRHGDTGAPLRLETLRLTVLAPQDLARTDEPVRVRSAAGRGTAIGMRAYLDVGRVELDDAVWSRYAPGARDG